MPKFIDVCVDAPNFRNCMGLLINVLNYLYLAHLVSVQIPSSFGFSIRPSIPAELPLFHDYKYKNKLPPIELRILKFKMFDFLFQIQMAFNILFALGYIIN